MLEPLVSVIVPVYETEKYIRRAVESICNQTYKNIEVILVNDGSPDKSEKICLDLVNEDIRIKYFYQKNKGVAAARNLGLENAVGEYILFCDSDDEWKENLLETVIWEMNKHSYDMVRFGFESKNINLIESDELPEKVYKQKELFIEYFSNNKLYKNISTCWSGVYRLSIIKDRKIIFDERLKHGEDGKFVVQYMTYCDNVKYINKKLYIYYPLFEDRITATSRNTKELYNEYELCSLLFEEFYNKWDLYLNEEEKKMAYSAFYDRIIGRLVRFAAYSTTETMEKDIINLRNMLTKRYMLDAGQYYKRKRDTDSRIIPFLMKKQMVYFLWLMLRFKKENYYQLYGKKQYVESIWKKDKLIKFAD